MTKIAIDAAVVRQALEALDALYINDYSGYECSKHEAEKIGTAKHTLRQALEDAQQEHTDAKPFPPRIMSVIEDIASRYANGFSGPWHDDEGPMQDAADEAIAWIAAHGDVKGDQS